MVIKRIFLVTVKNGLENFAFFADVFLLIRRDNQIIWEATRKYPHMYSYIDILNLPIRNKTITHEFNGVLPFEESDI